MKRFLVIYNGPPAPPDSTHAGWWEWFGGLGEALVEVGSSMTGRVVVQPDGSTSDEASALAGYCIVQAEDTSAAIELVRDHPLLAPGSEYTLELFEVPRK
jgi:hypothetical protein